MQWKKLGLIFHVEERDGWLQSHAALPVAIQNGNDTYQVLFSSRDKENRSRIGCFSFNIENLSILDVSTNPVLGLGNLGAFDESGVTTSWVTLYNNSYYLYYTGWTRGVTVPFYFYIGLATTTDLKSGFKRVSLAPIMGRNLVDPYLTASPCVLLHHNIWRMWYVSGQRWQMRDESPRHYYHIKYAESGNGIDWHSTGKVCIDFKDESEYALARPSVLFENGRYRMWYAYRGEKYLIGYAESNDGLQWQRLDGEAGILPSANGWDSEMIEYPYVFRHGTHLYMLYNGNDYGRTGIGLAMLD